MSPRRAHLFDNGISTTDRDTLNAVEIACVRDTTQAFPNKAPDTSNFCATDTVKVNG